MTGYTALAQRRAVKTVNVWRFSEKVNDGLAYHRRHRHRENVQSGLSTENYCKDHECTANPAAVTAAKRRILPSNANAEVGVGYSELNVYRMLAI